MAMFERFELQTVHFVGQNEETVKSCNNEYMFKTSFRMAFMFFNGFLPVSGHSILLIDLSI